jgi:hypothetical protein
MTTTQPRHSASAFLEMSATVPPEARTALPGGRRLSLAVVALG